MNYYLAIKILFALERLRMETFMSDKGKEFVDDFDDMILTAIEEEHNDACVELLWSLHKGYNELCLSLETAECENTCVSALCMKYTERWRVCKEVVKIGDYPLLAINGCNWIEFLSYKAIGMSQYLRKTKWDRNLYVPEAHVTLLERRIQYGGFIYLATYLSVRRDFNRLGVTYYESQYLKILDW